MKHIFKSSLSLALVFALIVSSFAFAAPGDVFKKADNSLYAKGSDLALLDHGDVKLMNLSNDPESYYYEAKDKKVFNLADVFDAYAKDKDNFQDVLASDATPAPVSPSAEGDAVVPIASDLEVVSIKASSKNALEITFNKEVDPVAIDNFKVAVAGKTLKVERVSVDTTKKVVTVKVPDLDYNNVVELDITGVSSDSKAMPNYNTIYTVPAVGEFYELIVSSEDESIDADGATKTMITVELVDKVTREAADVDGLIQFTTTKGEFAKSTVSLQDGKANVQLQSSASDEVVTAFINATVKDAPNNREYEGISKKYEVKFVPKGAAIEENILAAIQDAESNQADRIFVTMNKPVTRKDIINTFSGSTFEEKFKDAQKKSFGFLVDDKKIVKDIVQNSPTNLVLILDVDDANHPTTPMVPKAASTPEVTDKAYMRDNVTHTLKIAENVGVVLVKSETKFTLTDNKFPTIFGVDVDANRLIRVRFSEAMAEDIAEETETVTANSISHKVNRHFSINGQQILITANEKYATEAEKAYAKTNNLTIANRLYVGTDDNADRGDEEGYLIKDANDVTDSRHIVTIVLDKSARLTGGKYELQAARIGDWAGMSDPANIVETQTFTFYIDADASKPNVSVLEQSPEQWLVKFNQNVESSTGKKVRDVFAVYSNDNYAKSPKEAFKLDEDYEIYEVSAGKTSNGSGEPNFFSGKKLDSDDVVSGQYFLIEFKNDWTQKYKTNSTKVNYFHSTKNPYIITVANVENNAGNAIDAKVLELKTPYDGVSPSVDKTADVYSLDGKKANDQTAEAAGELIYVEMTEPIKMSVNGTGQNAEGITPSEKQGDNKGVPVPTYEFVQGNKSIPGKYVDGSLAADDYSFVIKPDTALSAGEWTVYIRSISDDIGNTSPTASYKFNVEEGEAASSDTKIAWVAFDDVKYVDENTKGFDRIYIKFTKPMATGEANSVGRTSNYSVNNQTLDSRSQVIAGIKGVTNSYDGVTINMPPNTLEGLNGNHTDFEFTLNVANNFKSADGEKLMGPYEITVKDAMGSSTNSDWDMKFDAYYHNATVHAALENMYTQVAAYDKKYVKSSDKSFADEGHDGNIDTITFYGGKTFADYDEDSYVLVSGNKFVWKSGSTFEAENAAAQVKGTDTSNISITTPANAPIISAPYVQDAAGPVMIKAVQENKEVTFTFSENIKITAVLDATKFAKAKAVTDKASTDFDKITVDEQLKEDMDKYSGNTIVFKNGNNPFPHDDYKYTNIFVENNQSVNSKLEGLLDNPYIQPNPIAGIYVGTDKGNRAVDAKENIEVKTTATTATPSSTGIKTTVEVVETGLKQVAGDNSTFKVIKVVDDGGTDGIKIQLVDTIVSDPLTGWTIKFVDDKDVAKDATTVNVERPDYDNKIITFKGAFAKKVGGKGDTRTKVSKVADLNTAKTGLVAILKVDNKTELAKAVEAITFGPEGSGPQDTKSYVASEVVERTKAGKKAVDEKLAEYKITVDSSATAKGKLTIVIKRNQANPVTFTTAEIKVAETTANIVNAIEAAIDGSTADNEAQIDGKTYALTTSANAVTLKQKTNEGEKETVKITIK